MFKRNGKYISSEDEYEKFRQFDKRYYHFYVSSKNEQGQLLFTCNSLKEDNTCKNYWQRSLFCRSYPVANSQFFVDGGQTIDGCGYYFEPKKKFEEYIKK